MCMRDPAIAWYQYVYETDKMQNGGSRGQCLGLVGGVSYGEEAK